MDQQFSRLCRELVNALANIELWQHRGLNKMQLQYWRQKARRSREQLQALCDERGIELFVAVQTSLFDDDEE